MRGIYPFVYGHSILFLMDYVANFRPFNTSIRGLPSVIVLLVVFIFKAIDGISRSISIWQTLKEISENSSETFIFWEEVRGKSLIAICTATVFAAVIIILMFYVMYFINFSIIAYVPCLLRISLTGIICSTSIIFRKGQNLNKQF